MEIFNLIPQFGGLIWTILAFVVALSVIVAVHEYGHYIVGRWSGIHAEVFSLGFGPVLLSRVDKRGTRWQIAALPFGGYVKFLGDADAASGKDEDTMARMAAQNPEALRHTMHGAPLWARTATVAAGPVFNFALSILVFSVMSLSSGQVRDPLTVGEIRPLPVQSWSLASGDQLIEVEGLIVPPFGEKDSWAAFVEGLGNQADAAGLTYTVRRKGQDVVVQGPNFLPPLVGQVAPRSAAYEAGLKHGDVIVAVDGAPIHSFGQLKTAVEGSDGKALALDVWRAGDMHKMSMTPRWTDEPNPKGGFQSQWRIGIAGDMAIDFAAVPIGPIDALEAGVKRTWSVISSSLSGLWHMITGAISTCNISGPIGIAETSGAMASQGATNFVWFIAVLSTAVGMLNLFPIPALDGGHLVFYAYEAVAGKPPSDRVLTILMAVGISMILSLMVFSIGNDLFC